MTALRSLFSAIADGMTPDGTFMRMRFRTTLDVLLTTAITILAVMLAVGYPVIGRLARRAGWVD